MGGADKGLQLFHGVPLALHTLQRLRPQVGPIIINANRNAAVYEGFGAGDGVQVCPDADSEFSGPLAGFLAGLCHCHTPYLVTVPCDSPLFPSNWVARLGNALLQARADIAMVAAPEADRDGSLTLRAQPVFCLMRTALGESLRSFMATGGRKIDAWTAQHVTVLVPFDAPGDDAHAFFNANTLEELHWAQGQSGVLPLA